MQVPVHIAAALLTKSWFSLGSRRVRENTGNAVKEASVVADTKVVNTGVQVNNELAEVENKVDYLGTGVRSLCF